MHNSGMPLVGLENLLKRDRAIVMTGLVLVTALAWAYVFYLAHGTKEAATPHIQPLGGLDFLLAFVMWAVMMTAMMVPSAAPTILIFATINRKRREQGNPFVHIGFFLLSYLAAWAGYSALAAVTQWGLHNAAMLSPKMALASPILSGGLLLTAGVFQFTPLKYACLTRCRTPVGFIMTEWREGRRGAFIMGLRNGNYCVGCCWALMALIFVAGVMSLLWMAIIAAFVLLEKVAPGGRRVSHISGLLFIAWGIWMVVGGLR